MADESKTSDVATLLAKFTVDDFPFTRKVVYVDGNTLLEDAFKIMGQNGVSSLPVHSDGAWVGFIDINDLVTHVAQLYRAATGTSETIPACFTSLRTLLQEESALIPKQVVSAVNLSKNNPFLPVGPGTSLLDVFKTLATKTEGNKSVHRVPVVDAEGRITKIISQSAAIQFLYAHVDELGGVSTTTLEKLGLARKPVYTVKATAPVLTGFDLMAQHHLSGVAVVNDDGAVVCSLSAADVRFMVAIDKFSLVSMDAISFVATCRQMDHSRISSTMAPLVAVQPASPMRHVIGKLAATRVHRLFVVEARALVGVVSLKDILRKLLATELADGDTEME